MQVLFNLTIFTTLWLSFLGCLVTVQGHTVSLLLSEMCYSTPTRQCPSHPGVTLRDLWTLQVTRRDEWRQRLARARHRKSSRLEGHVPMPVVAKTEPGQDLLKALLVRQMTNCVCFIFHCRVKNRRFFGLPLATPCTMPLSCRKIFLPVVAVVVVVVIWMTYFVTRRR